MRCVEQAPGGIVGVSRTLAAARGGAAMRALMAAASASDLTSASSSVATSAWTHRRE